MEWNDIYDKDRNLTGRTHRRGTPWRSGEYGLVVCVWVYDDEGRLLLTRRAPEKSFAGTWENSGGAAKAGETSLQAIRRELSEETGIQAEESEFQLIASGTDRNAHYDFYSLHRNIPISQIVLLPGETDDVKWATFDQVHDMIREKIICKVIARQFRKQESMLKSIISVGRN
jgi:8-oxo-dGTP pyrophosphatase MutT (NUDIX family)